MMIKISKWIVVSVVLVVFAVAAPVAFAQEPDTGKTLWEEQVSQCQKCHGPMGEGAWAGPLAGTTGSAEAWIEQVRTPRNRMPSFSVEQVSDAMLVDMHAYLASLTKPDGFSPAQADLPADAPEGQQLMVDKKCVACHGVNGPINGFIQRGETPTVERMLVQLRTPFKAMPAYSAEQVNDEEAALITDFLVSQMPPAALPESGGQTETIANLPYLGTILLLLGSTLVLMGLAFKKWIFK